MRNLRRNINFWIYKWREKLINKDQKKTANGIYYTKTSEISIQLAKILSFKINFT